jgi:D-alanine--poly(phosphoribitol) ligase subunit 1
MFLRSLLATLHQKRDRNAFCIHDVHYTYEELYRAVHSTIAQINATRQDDSRKNIAVMCTDDFGTYASLLAIWFSGCAYVPLGLHSPADRNLSILQDADVEVILSVLPIGESTYPGYSILKPAIGKAPGNPTTGVASGEEISLPALDGSSLAYILFTSGSTGTPKGVPISLNSLDAFVNNFMGSPFKISEDDRCLQMFDLTFDVSISSFLVPLICGACVYTVPDHAIKYMHVLKLLQTYRLTSLQIVPSVVKLSMPLLKRLSFPWVKHCIFTGEATHAYLLEEWRKCIPDARMFNYYGPTEATIYCSFYECPREEVKTYHDLLAIGRQLGDSTLIIVDSGFDELPANEKGELLIAGDQLTLGYINNPAKWSESVVSIPVNGSMTGFYRSGDLCYKDEEGDIYYCGRMDNQVKVQGFRVELNEIETLVRNKFSIENIVVPFENEAGIVELILVIERQEDEAVIAKIKPFLKSKLPVYMIPGKLIQIESFPYGTSGKLSRQGVKEMILHEV